MAGRELTKTSDHQNYDEIFKLEAKLRSAYTQKVLKNQIAEKNATLQIEEIRRKFEEKTINTNIELEIQKESRKAKNNYLQICENYKNELQNQIKLKEEEKKKITQQERRERIMLQELTRIENENEEFRKLIEKYELRESVEKSYLLQMELNEIIKRQNEDSAKQEDEKSRKYIEILEQRNLMIEQQEEEKLRKKEESISLVAEIIITVESNKQKREAILMDLITNELQNQVMIFEKEEQLKRTREKNELTNSLNKQIFFNKECKRRFLERDKIFADAVMKRIVEDERLERLTLEARKRKSLKYRDDVEKLIEEKKLLREGQIIRIQEELESEHLRETMMIESIRNERISLLEKHMESVAEFINSSGLTTEEQKILASYLNTHKL